MRVILISLIIFVGAARALPKGYEHCQGSPLVESSRNSVFAWLKSQGNGNHSIEDIVCCMPQKFRDDYLVAHSSISAQASHYKSPRVIFGNLQDDGIVFSIATNADPSLPQSNNIEIMVKQGSVYDERLAVYDLEVKGGQKRLSENNPDGCIACHGHAQFKVSGPRPIFDSFPWPRLTGERLDACVKRVAFMKKATEVAEAAVKNSPRFKCLRPPGGSLPPPPNAQGFLKNIPVARHDPLRAEFALRQENDKRITRELVQDPEFLKVQPFLVGLKKGCLVSGAALSPDAKIIDLPQSWFAPRGKDEKLLNIDSGLAKLTSAADLSSLVEARLRQYDLKVAQQEAKFKEMTDMLEQGQLPPFDSRHGSLSCVGSNQMQSEVNAFKDDIERLPLEIKKYAYDDILKSVENGHPVIKGELRLKETLLRWSLESRGIDTLGWDIHVQPNYHFDVTNVMDRLPLGDKYKDIPNGFEVDPLYKDSTKYKKFSEMCRELKALSLAAQGPPKTQSSLSEPATTR